MSQTHIASPNVVLIVDDEEDIVDILIACAKRAGFRGMGAYSTEQAQKILATEPVFLLSLDFRMPQEDGLTFYERIQRAGSNIPAVLITASNDALMREKASMLGIAHIVNKPFSTASIAELYKSFYQGFSQSHANA